MARKLKVKAEEPIGRSALARPGSRNLYMGVSLGNQYFSKEAIEAHMRFGLEHFDETHIIVADWPERWNYVALKGVDYDEAVERALSAGQSLIRGFNKVVHKLEDEGVANDCVHVVSYHDLVRGDESYEHVLAEVHREYETNPIFERDMRRFLFQNIGGRIRETGLEGSTLEEAVQVSSRYLIEETALMYWLAEVHPGRFVNMYPISYSHQIFEKGVNNGRYPEFTERLGMEEGIGYVHVELMKPIIDRVSDRVARMFGKNPQHRRELRDRTADTLHDLVPVSSLAATALVLFGPAVAVELATRERLSRVEVDGRSCIVKEYKSGRVNVSFDFNPFVSFIDDEGDGHLDRILHTSRFGAFEITSGERFDEAEKTYQAIQKELC